MTASNLGFICALALTLSACGSSSPQRTSISSQEARLVLSAPGLERSEPRLSRTKLSFSQEMEKGEWLPPDKDWPRAIIYYAVAGSNHYYTDHGQSTLEELFESLFVKGQVVLGAKGKAKNHMGALESRRFRLSGRSECVLMRQYIGFYAGDDVLAGQILGDKLILGYYCAAPGEPLSDVDSHAFFNGIGIRGVALPPVSRT